MNGVLMYNFFVQVCSGETNPFSIDVQADNENAAGVDGGKAGSGAVADGACLTEDYVIIGGM